MSAARFFMFVEEKGIKGIFSGIKGIFSGII